VRARQIIARQSGHLARMLDGLLDVSRITRGKIVLQLRPLNLALLERALVALASRRPLDPYAITVESEPVWPTRTRRAWTR
jgi:signal transduction histidine kinase